MPKILSMQIDVNDLWIGDRVRVQGKSEVFTFVGLAKNGKAVIKRGGIKSEIDPTTIVEVVEEEEIEEVIDNEPVDKVADLLVSNEIDLHIEHLNPSMANQRPERIVDFQVQCCRDYIIMALEMKMPRFVIIHGKGAGVLKSEVVHLLSLYPQIKKTQEIHQGGAMEVFVQ